MIKIALFTKTPIAGKVKTRLIPLLGQDKALALHQALMRQCLRHACASGAETELWVTSDLQHEAIQACAQAFKVPVYAQQGDDLGMRMYHACELTLAGPQCNGVILLGADCVAVGPTLLDEMAEKLLQGMQAVIIPATDGGYVALGLREANKQLFIAMPWGSSAVLASTLAKLDQLNWKYHTMPALWDVDDEADIKQLCAVQASFSEPLLRDFLFEA